MNIEPPPVKNDDRFLPEETWIGDRVYVWFDLVPLVLVCGGVLVALGSIQQTSNSGLFVQSPVRSEASSALGILCCAGAIILPLMFFVLRGIWFGKKWAYIVELVLVATSFMSSNTGRLVLSAIGMVAGLLRIVFIAMRLGGAVGPPLK